MTEELQDITQTSWSLSDLYPSPDSPELTEAFEQLQKDATDFETVRSQLTDEIDANAFLTIIQKLESVTSQVHRISAYAELLHSGDTQDQTAQNLLVRIEQLAAEVSNRMMFFSLWWKELSDETANRLLENSGDYRYWLEEIRHFKEYTLSEKEEQIINIKDVTGASAINLLYSSITNRYSFDLEVDGQIQHLTRGELSIHMRSSDANLREKAYQELYRVYGNDGPVLGLIYQTLVRDWRNENITLRGFKSPIAVRNLANDIPDQVTQTLLDVCQQNTDGFKRFFKLKARWLGTDKLRRYDLYAPVSQSNKQYTYHQAYEMVMDSFEQFDPDFSKKAQQLFHLQHVDSEVRKGKRSGAFCLTALPQLTPWVLLNFQGRAEDAATMAHELGHAIHSLLAEHHNLFTFHACLPLAETASTFAEMMLVDNLLAKESDQAVRRDMLFRQVDDSYATILRQAYFALFEQKAHEIIARGASVEELCDAYMENLEEQFGDSIEISEDFRWEWVSIPHIYNVPFYVYAYTFGQLLVLSLYQQYKSEGKSFIPRYKKILSTGGSQAPVRLLADAGIDITQDTFWQGGFDLIKDLVKQLEAMPMP